MSDDENIDENDLESNGSNEVDESNELEESNGSEELDLDDIETIEIEKKENIDITEKKVDDKKSDDINPDDIKPVDIDVKEEKTADQPKKRPGRPKKHVVKKTVPKLGIVK